ncbi:hypothetical protein BX659_11622 [Orenia metallireducens]|uniref:Polymer-forming protein n=1 Tax=Orenia metallireducens TaxID=1413210 RepID=A0A285HFI0_9FIRM|nr:hypothetical protein [Orenia metallireducens]PRX27433.1 hypothetical protein BX659_11622 [Orenia metallireducens]SNY34417.1 hypothetical protein SAMN06265827_11819 [Orenia metallireducens]
MRKFFSLSLIFLLSLVVLAGCGGNQTATTEQEPKEEIDTVTTASIVSDEAAFVKAISKDGTWIIATLNNLSFDKELVVEGTFHNKGKASNDVYRKLAPYTQDENHNITESFTITAPKMIIKSPNTRFQGGIFVGDIYVEANGFNVNKATVKGNIYFAKEEYKDSFSVSKGEVTGVSEVKGEADVVTAASIVSDGEVFKKAIGKDGKWIIATLNDLTFDEELVVEGTFHDKGKSSNKVYRKLAPYAQDESHNITEKYTITAPKMIIKSPNTRFQGGIFIGDIYVEANGFNVNKATVKGNIYFAKEEYKDSFTVSKGEVTGVTEVK